MYIGRSFLDIKAALVSKKTTSHCPDSSYGLYFPCSKNIDTVRVLVSETKCVGKPCQRAKSFTVNSLCKLHCLLTKVSSKQIVISRKCRCSQNTVISSQICPHKNVLTFSVVKEMNVALELTLNLPRLLRSMASCWSQPHSANYRRHMKPRTSLKSATRIN